MTYRPDNQSIADPLNKIVAAIKEFRSATEERAISVDAWNDEHIQELYKVLKKLEKVERKHLRYLIAHNW